MPASQNLWPTIVSNFWALFVGRAILSATCHLLLTVCHMRCQALADNPKLAAATLSVRDGSTAVHLAASEWPALTFYMRVCIEVSNTHESPLHNRLTSGCDTRETLLSAAVLFPSKQCFDTAGGTRGRRRGAAGLSEAAAGDL